MQSLVAKLGLGAAQFGLDGGAPYRGRSPEAEVREMLILAAKAELRVLDAGAASNHGEAVLGAVSPRPSPFAVTVKAARGDRGPDHVEAEARASLRRLGLERADAIVVQSAGDLFSASGLGDLGAPEGSARGRPLRAHRHLGLCVGRPGRPRPDASSPT